MMIARWHCEAQFGYKGDVIALLKEWQEQIGSQTGMDFSQRFVTGSVGAKEAAIEAEFEIGGLGELQQFFDKIATIKMHEDWGKRMNEVIVSGSTYWEVYRVVE